MICPLGADLDAMPDYVSHPDLLSTERFSPEVIERLRRLMRDYRFIWATSWGDEANRTLAPALGFPELPLIDFTASEGTTESYKLGPIKEYVKDQPMVWIDDMIFDDAFAWAAARKAPTLLLRTDPAVGLTDDHFEALDQFLRSHADA